MSTTKLTAERLLELSRRHLIVRVCLRALSASTGYPNGRLRTQVEICSFHADCDTNRLLFLVSWWYHEPCSDYSELAKLDVHYLGNINDEENKTSTLKRLDEVIALWSDQVPPWAWDTPEIACANAHGAVQQIGMEEVHVLQHLARLQTAISAQTVNGHPHQYYLCELVYSLGSFIERHNRNLERFYGLSVQTPAKY